MRMKLGELLVKANLVSPQQVREGLSHQQRNGGRLGQALVALGHVKEEAITSLLSRRYGVPEIKLDGFPLDPAMARLLPAELAWKHKVLALSRSGATLQLAMGDPTNVQAMEEVKQLTGYNVEPAVASETALEAALEQEYGAPDQVAAAGETRGPGSVEGVDTVLPAPSLTLEDMAYVGLSEVDVDAFAEAEAEEEAVETEEEVDLGNLDRSAEVSPLVKLVNVMLVDSLKRGAAEIHVEPYEREFRIRLRIDGVLYNAMALPLRLREPLTSRLKTMGRLDVTERRLPQKGRIRIVMKLDGDRSREADFGISTLPTRWGEKLVLRHFDKSKLSLDLSKLGFEPPSLERFKEALARPAGIVVVAGPRASGRTNTLLSALGTLNRADVNVLTIEDQVQFELAGINQTTLHRGQGFDFQPALQACLQQDVNIVAMDPIGADEMVKEVVRLGARSGLFFLATLLEADAPSALLTLVEGSGEASDVARAVRVVVAQRLVRRICSSCKVEVADVPIRTLIDVGLPPQDVGSFKVCEGKGCASCNGTGYRGRAGLFEVLVVSEGIRDLVRVEAVASEIRRKAVEEGMLTLRRSGLEKVRAGITTIDEVVRETTL